MDQSEVNDGLDSDHDDGHGKHDNDSELDDNFPEDEFDDWEDDESAQQGCDLAQHVDDVIGSAPTTMATGGSAPLQGHNPSRRGGPGKSPASIPALIEVYYADLIVTLETEIKKNPS